VAAVAGISKNNDSGSLAGWEKEWNILSANDFGVDM